MVFSGSPMPWVNETMRGHHARVNTPILTVKDVAGLLKVSECTIYRLLTDRQIPAFRIGGDWRFHREQLQEWIKAQERVRA